MLLVPLQLNLPHHSKLPRGALWGCWGEIPYAWGVLSEATAERRIPKAFGTSGSAAPRGDCWREIVGAALVRGVLVAAW